MTCSKVHSPFVWFYDNDYDLDAWLVDMLPCMMDAATTLESIRLMGKQECYKKGSSLDKYIN